MQCDTIVRDNIRTFKNIIPDASNPYAKSDSGLCNSSCDLENQVSDTGTNHCLLCKKVQNKMNTLLSSSGINSFPDLLINRSSRLTSDCHEAESQANFRIGQIASYDAVIARNNNEIKILKEKLILKDALMKKLRDKISNLDTNLNESVVKEKTKGKTGFDIWNFYFFGVSTEYYVWVLVTISILLTILFFYLTYESILNLINYYFV
jgi:hypothetical protein